MKNRTKAKLVYLTGCSIFLFSLYLGGDEGEAIRFYIILAAVGGFLGGFAVKYVMED